MGIHKGEESQGSLLVFKSKRDGNIKESLTKAEFKRETNWGQEEWNAAKVVLLF